MSIKYIHIYIKYDTIILVKSMDIQEELEKYEEKEYVLKINERNDSFEPKHIFECGQCFRWNKQEDESYTGVFGQNVIKVKKEKDKIVFKGICKENENIQKICEKYFDLNTDYEKIKEKLSKVDENLKQSIIYGKGIRILQQDLWETLISFIISTNNNIPRIKGIIERLCKNYGNKIIWKEKEYYTFPTPEQLHKADISDLRRLGLGFRDIRVYETTNVIIQNPNLLKDLENEKDVNKLRDKLLTFRGVGPKVADCIMLFSLNRLEVFPIDVWVRRVMNELYIQKQDENKVSKNQIENLAKEKYGNLAGIAQQYLFYWRREA